MLRQVLLVAAVVSASAFAPTSILPTRYAAEGYHPCLYRCHVSFLDILLEHVIWDYRLQRPVARSSNIVAQQQLNGAESVDEYSLRLRESSGKARLLQALPSAAVLSQLAFPVQVSFAPLQPSNFYIASGLTPVLMR